ncbi:MAG: ABC transporter ATP-binding protein [Faecalibacterium sp.]|nr:ABC transporter ATP-binding protein [Ruminococcus sp.]MCM1391732.1 ABC transporter ATP-binding protein [Ruminococcus sp.]MCM1485355.1 ABC transporter ATP-binding protein [Faecalibacterium sp.]
MSEVAIELKNITKRFGTVVANKNVSLTVNKGEILSILGENGSGKTTLMNMLSGIYHPDEGHIYIDGQEASIKSPKDAFDYKIGMIHQHFKLVDVLNVTENIILGLKDGEKYNVKKSAKKIGEICEQFGFEVDPMKRIYEMSVSEKQTVEIIKVIYRGAEILILDEPTAVLTPKETDKLFAILRNMKNSGKAIIIITHKLNEVLAISDRVAVLRKGEYIGTVDTKDATEQSLTEMMVGKKISLNIERSEPKNQQDRLVLTNVSVVNNEGVNVLKNVNFTAKSGEILGIAGIAGSGQKELLESIAGLQHLKSGSIIYHDPATGKEENLKDKTPLQIRNLGVRLSFVPEDRLGMGLVGAMGITENMMLRSYNKDKGLFLKKKDPKNLAEKIIADLEVVTPGTETPVRRLSGGNVQKVLVGREIEAAPTVLMAAYPVRGLDINSSYTIYNLLNKQKEIGTAVIFVGEDLDVLLELCDRIIVMCHGKISGVVDGRNATKEEIGLMMTSDASYDESANDKDKTESEDGKNE